MRQDEKYCCGAIFSLFCRMLNPAEIIFLWQKRIWELITKSSAGAAASTYQQTVCTPPFRERKIVAIVFLFLLAVLLALYLPVRDSWIAIPRDQRSNVGMSHHNQNPRRNITQERQKGCLKCVTKVVARQCAQDQKEHGEDTLFKSYHSN